MNGTNRGRNADLLTSDTSHPSIRANLSFFVSGCKFRPSLSVLWSFLSPFRALSCDEAAPQINVWVPERCKLHSEVKPRPKKNNCHVFPVLWSTIRNVKITVLAHSSGSAAPISPLIYRLHYTHSLPEVGGSAPMYRSLAVFTMNSSCAPSSQSGLSGAATAGTNSVDVFWLTAYSHTRCSDLKTLCIAITRNKTTDFAPDAASWKTRRNMHVVSDSAHSLYYVKTLSHSRKPEVHNVLHFHQRTTKPWQQIGLLYSQLYNMYRKFI